jgi:hypothetical protein
MMDYVVFGCLNFLQAHTNIQNCKLVAGSIFLLIIILAESYSVVLRIIGFVDFAPRQLFVNLLRPLIEVISF